MDSNRNYPEDRHYPEGGSRRNLEENQRVGRDIYRSRGDQQWNEQYRSGQSHHNRNEGYGPDQTHYGSQPDSAYRDPNRINYGDNQQYNQNQRPNQNQQWDRDSRYNQNYRGQQNRDNANDRDNRRFDDPPRGDHGGTRFWGEREEFKQDDYRYTSGNRGTWHTPGTDDDDDYNNRYRNRNYRQQDQNNSFFDRMSERIDNTWDRLTGKDHDNDRNQDHDRNRHPQNRNFNQGYESGPRWADEDDRRERYNRHDDY